MRMKVLYDKKDIKTLSKLMRDLLERKDDKYISTPEFKAEFEKRFPLVKNRIDEVISLLNHLQKYGSNDKLLWEAEIILERITNRDLEVER